MVRELSFKWNKGFIIVRYSGNNLVIEAANTQIEISDRQITIRGLYSGLREYFENPKAVTKTIYVDLAFPITGLEKSKGTVYLRQTDTYIENFGLSYTPLDEIGYFLTIYPPQGALYENIILASDMIAITTLRRRQVYIMEEGEERTIILV